MPKKSEAPMIVATYDGRVAGWVGSEKGGRLYGDAEWVDISRKAAETGIEFTLYQDIELKAGIDDPNNPAAAFAALAFYAKERMQVVKAPEGMMAFLGLLDEPVTLDALSDAPDDATEEEKQFALTHTPFFIDDEEVWVPLKAFTRANTPAPRNMTELQEILAQGVKR